MKAVRVLITVKTYPTLSSTYGELVCIAGIREDGKWVRIYPMPFRRLKEYYKFKKYSWIELPLEKNAKDPRPESFRPVDLTAIKTFGSMGTGDKWFERRKFIFKNVKCYDDIEEIISLAKIDNKLSLALFKPTKLIDFYWENDQRDWDRARFNDVVANLKQGYLFKQEEFIEDFKIASKLPFKFKYKFSDINGKVCNLSIIDWEVGALFWKYDDEQKALEKVKEKYWDYFTQKCELYFYLGTTKQYHSWSNNPFTIIGTFTPPLDNQQMLDF